MKERWRPVTDYEGLYEVSDHGNVRSLDREIPCFNSFRISKGRILSPARYPNGYLFVQLHYRGASKPRMVHRLVAEAFLKNPSGLPVVMHRDDDVTHNHFKNLCWGTQKDNMHDMIDKNRNAVGKQNGNAKLTERQVTAIRVALAKGVTGRSLALKYGVQENHISHIKNRKGWKHV